MSGLAPLLGHETLRTSLARSVRRGDLASAILLHGPSGIGKQRLALWLAQRLVCSGNQAGEPCGACRECRLALHLEHPDIHWFFPLARPKGASGPEKLAEALEDARAAELAARRADPHALPQQTDTMGIYLVQVQTMRRLAHARPAMGSRKIFIVGDAENLVTQEASQEAANALLKLLEEPPADTTVVVTAADPEALLPTLRSRLLPLRIRPLPEEDVAGFLGDVRRIPDTDARVLARLAEGSIGRALGFAPAGDDAGPLEELRREAKDMLAAALDGNAAHRLATAHAQAPAGARGSFGAALVFLTIWIRDLAATAAGAEEAVVNTDALDWLRQAARRARAAAAGSAAALQHVDDALELGKMNVNPQLTLAWLLRILHTDLVVTV